MNSKIQQAISYLKENGNSNSTATILLPAGRFDLDSNTDQKGTLMFNGLETDSDGSLVLKGAGRGKTTLVFTDFEQSAVYGKMIKGLTLQGLHFTREHYSATQGEVVSTAPGEVVIKIHRGFPKPDFLWRYKDLGHYLRRATNSTTDPLIILTDNDQVKYGYRDGAPYPPEHVKGRQWKFYLANKKLDLEGKGYSKGSYVAIKAKKSGFPYEFRGGERLTMDDIKWTHSTRGIIRGTTLADGTRYAFNDITISNCLIARAKPRFDQTPILSASGGGIQLNQPDDLPANNILVKNCRLESTGDDNIALFNVNNVRLENLKSNNAFARSILVTSKARNLCGSNISVTNGVIENDKQEPVTIAECD
ncbi:right-handed parallel beta-helix repeat-containing protein [Shewanella corallii]|uniref:Right-handed parallel beta-helix repeat-containing protein n=1 Tax=Shewanella corallii TaxID=560080 RepID=A0ABT0NDQ6_9GAMM|nr:right-handed parallel beta-helix repeat-containing protein [Shewanella corallii]MCL2916485.1 right-handed parallel beta-helix repeat-containing protein [Shewanella corallii]